MEIEFYDDGADRNSADLVEWLRDEKVPEVRFDLKLAPAEPGTMSGGLLPIIQAIQAALPDVQGSVSLALSAPAVLLVIRSIGTWLQATKRKAKIQIRCPNGAELYIETEANKNVDDKIAELVKLCAAPNAGIKI